MMPPGKNPSAVIFAPSTTRAAKYSPILTINLRIEDLKHHEN